MTNAEQVAQNIVGREGMPVARDVGDGAGVTFPGGQTQGWLDTFGLNAPADEAEAATNIIAWLAASGLIVVVNADLALGDCVADYAYNVGLRAAVKALQAAIGVTPDGVFGPVTTKALQGRTDLSALVRDVAIQRVKDIAAGVTHGVTQPQFTSGLINRALAFL